jgi:hypothetical protein
MTDSMIATVAFVAGGVLLAGGAALFFTARPGSGQSTARGMRLVPSVGPGGTGMLLRGAF